MISKDKISLRKKEVAGECCEMVKVV